MVTCIWSHGHNSVVHADHDAREICGGENGCGNGKCEIDAKGDQCGDDENDGLEVADGPVHYFSAPGLVTSIFGFVVQAKCAASDDAFTGLDAAEDLGPHRRCVRRFRLCAPVRFRWPGRPSPFRRLHQRRAAR